MLGNFGQRSTDQKKRVKKRNKTSKSTVLPQAEAKGSMFFPWPARNAALAILNFSRFL